MLAYSTHERGAVFHSNKILMKGFKKKQRIFYGLLNLKKQLIANFDQALYSYIIRSRPSYLRMDRTTLLTQKYSGPRTRECATEQSQ